MAVTDDRVQGLVNQTVDPLRYGGQIYDPYETSGIVIKMIPKGARVLDIGCGTGGLSAMIRDHCDAEVIGVEPHFERANKAEERGICVIRAELDEAELTKLGQFDVIFFGDVLEHLVDPGAMLDLVWGALKPGGFVAASVPNIAHWTVRLALLRGRFDYQDSGIMDATHLRWFTASTIKKLFELSNYRVKKQFVSSGYWLPHYKNRLPWKWLKSSYRDKVVKRLSVEIPTLFGCQHVVQAMPVKRLKK